VFTAGLRPEYTSGWTLASFLDLQDHNKPCSRKHGGMKAGSSTCAAADSAPHSTPCSAAISARQDILSSGLGASMLSHLRGMLHQMVKKLYTMNQKHRVEAIYAMQDILFLGWAPQC